MSDENAHQRVKQFRGVNFGLIKIVNQKNDQCHRHIAFVINQSLKFNNGQTRKNENDQGEKELIEKNRAQNESDI